MQLTDTNRSRAYPKTLTCKREVADTGTDDLQTRLLRIQFSRNNILELFGDNGGGEPHVPISNTTVKPSSADGTWTEGSWESRTLPSRIV